MAIDGNTTCAVPGCGAPISEPNNLGRCTGFRTSTLFAAAAAEFAKDTVLCNAAQEACQTESGQRERAKSTKAGANRVIKDVRSRFPSSRKTRGYPPRRP